MALAEGDMELRPSIINTYPENWGWRTLAVRQEKGRFLAVDVIKLLKETKENRVTIANEVIKINHRIRLILDYPKCVFCDLECVLAIVEKHNNDLSWSVHFYGEKGNHIVRLTVDHIVPKSKGGSDSMTNYQTSCSDCNTKKGNIVTDPFAAAQIRHRGKHGPRR